MLGASQAVLLGAAGCVQKPASYANTVAGIPGLLAYWRFSDTTGVIDAAGQRHGTYDGEVSLVPGLPTDSDAATRLPGNVVGTVPHDEGLELPAFTLSLWARVLAFPGGGNAVIMGKNLPGPNSGDFALWAQPSGDLIARFENDEAPHDDVVWSGFQLNTTYHIVVTASSDGVALWVDGKMVDLNSSFIDAWTNNVQNIELATTVWTAAITDIVLDEVAIFSRVLDDDEIIALSQAVGVPVAVPGAIVVDEGTSATVVVVDDCMFVGRKSDLVIDAIPGSRGMVSVNATNDLVYTAHPGEGGESDSFQYRITDPNGTSEYATVGVTIQDVAGGEPVDDVPAALINPYPATSGDTVVVSSMAALESAVNNAPPGRHVLIAAGTYTGGTHTFNRNGTLANPIVIRPQGARGSVTINSPTWTLASGSSRLVLANLFLNNPQINLQGTNNRITRCRWRQVGRSSINPNGTNLRVDHNDVSDYVNNATNKHFFNMHHSNITSGSLKGILFDHNYIHDITQTTDALASFIRTTSTQVNPELFLERCLFRNTSINSHGEFIVNKWPGGKIRFCTFENISGYLSQRSGGGWEVRSNWFEGGGSQANKLQCFDQGPCFGNVQQLVIGNRFVGGIGMWVSAGNQLACGNPGGSMYAPSRNGRFIGNVFDTGTIMVGGFWSSLTATSRASGNLLAANTRNGAPATTGNGISLEFEQGTAISATTDESFAPAVKLGPADVGMAAPDPYHPSGPQS